MLRTRLWMGTVLVLLAAGLLVVDQWLAPWYPFLFALLLGGSLASCFELVRLVDTKRVRAWLCFASVTAMVLANWCPHVPVLSEDLAGPWTWIVGVFGLLVAVVFAVEVAAYREPGGIVDRMARNLLVICYLGVLPSFLAQLRWLETDPGHGTVVLALAIFVVKASDIGAYTMGRLLGRHPMTPLLSPKKTVEGGLGGLVFAVAAAVGIDQLAPFQPLNGKPALEAAFGLTMGLLGMLGDLAESLIKRDSGHKDASQVMPGFGGVLDVVDSVIFTAPLAYGWFALLSKK